MPKYTKLLFGIVESTGELVCGIVKGIEKWYSTIDKRQIVC